MSNRGFSLYGSGMNTLPSRFPRRASATGSKIEQCPRASADELLEYLGEHARACGISSKSRAFAHTQPRAQPLWLRRLRGARGPICCVDVHVK